MSIATKFSALVLALSGLSAAAIAEGDFAITGSAGTMGGAVEGQFQINDHFQLRAGVNYLAFDQGIDVDDISYDGELDFPASARLSISIRLATVSSSPAALMLAASRLICPPHRLFRLRLAA